MNNELNLTKDEKIDFIANLKYNPIHRAVEDCNVAISIFHFLFAVSIGAAAIMGPFLGYSVLSFSFLYSALAVVAIGTALCIPFFVVASNRKKEFKELNNGKITYKQFKQLKKEGKISEWQRQFEKEIELKVLEKSGITIEEYTENTEQEILNAVKNRLGDEKIAKLDSDKIASEIKNIINQSNENQR